MQERLRNRLLVRAICLVGIGVLAYFVFQRIQADAMLGRVGTDCIPQALPASSSRDSSVSILNIRTEAKRLFATNPDISEMQDFEMSYSGKRVEGWQGWIAEIPGGLYEADRNRYIVRVYMDNPFVDDASVEGKSKVDLFWGPDVDLSYFKPDDARQLAVGQKIAFCGELGRITDFGNGETLIAEIEHPVINPQPWDIDMSTPSIPADLVVKYIANGCGQDFSCPEYEVTVRADGSVVYVGHEGAKALGEVTTKINEQKLKELVALVEASDFFSVSNSDPVEMAQEKGSTVFTVTARGESKTLIYRWESKGQIEGSEKMPRKIRLLLDKMDELADANRLTKWGK